MNLCPPVERYEWEFAPWFMHGLNDLVFGIHWLSSVPIQISGLVTRTLAIFLFDFQLLGYVGKFRFSGVSIS